MDGRKRKNAPFERVRFCIEGCLIEGCLIEGYLIEGCWVVLPATLPAMFPPFDKLRAQHKDSRVPHPELVEGCACRLHT
jgi:hypothetical protein